MLYDAHNHLQDPTLAPHLGAILPTLTDLDLRFAIVNGTHPNDWARVAVLAHRLPWVRASYGVHPWTCGTLPTDWREQFQSRLEADPRACVGEIGLDRWLIHSVKPDDPRVAGLRRAPLDEQLAVFRWQLQWATHHDRPVTIHRLQAWGALLETLREITPRRFLLHAYGGPPEMVSEFVQLGAYFSFNPSFLDARKTRQRTAFRAMPTDRLLVETDAPAMAPPPEHRAAELPPAPGGTILSHPANLTRAYAGLAMLRSISTEELESLVAANFARCFD